MSKLSEVKEQLRVLVEEELKPVTYKWLARNNGLPANVAKQYLFAFAEGQRGKVDVTYLLAGWTRDPEQHVVRLISDKKLKEAKNKLSKVTGLHVYSIQPSQPKDAADFWNADVEQTNALFDQMVKQMESKGFSIKEYSAVYCDEAERDADFAKRLPAPPAAEPEQKPKPKSGPSVIGSKIDGIMAGRTANREGKVATSLAVSSKDGQAKDAMTNGPASAPAGMSRKDPAEGAKEARAVSIMPAKKAGAAAGKGAGSALGSMWSNAPARKAVSKAATTTRPQSKAVDAEAALQAAAEEAQKDSDSDDDEEDDFKPAQRRGANAALQSDDESEGQECEEDQSVKNTRKAAPSQEKLSNKTQQSGKQSASQRAAKGKAQPASRKRKPSEGTDDGIEADGTQELVPQKIKGPKFGGVKAGAAAGTKRQKVQRTIINDEGEEVTEDVWEDVIAAEAEDINPAKAGKDADENSQKLQDPAVKAEQPEKALPSRAKTLSPSRPPAGEKQSPSKIVAGGKKSTAGSKSKSGAAQKNIMSFFGKK